VNVNSFVSADLLPTGCLLGLAGHGQPPGLPAAQRIWMPMKDLWKV